MVVTNCVLLPFWVSDVLHRESRYLQQLLTVAVHDSTQLPSQQVPSSLQALLTDVPGSCVFWQDVHYGDERNETSCRQGMVSLFTQSDKARIGSPSPAAYSLPNLLASHYLYVVMPPSSPNGSDAAIGIPLASILHSLWNKERVILVYMLVNAIVLTAVVFFRLLKNYIVPVDRMVQAAEAYRSDDLQMFAFDRPTNELGHLAGSIQAMVRRIEEEKEKLSEALRELAETNTRLRENQQEMIRAEKLAAVGRLAAGLAHEIGNPLGVVQGYVQLMGMEDCSSTERLDYVHKALQELERVDQLIRQLLDHARIRPGEPTRFDVHQLLVETVESLELQPFFAGIRLHLDLEAGERQILAEYNQLRQVIVNCLLNAADAVKARYHGKGGEIVIDTIVHEPEPHHDQPGQLEIRIVDNGIGIAEHQLELVFDPFFTTKEPGAGTGLGLSVSLSLIEAMGGRMQLESKADEGTVMHIFLPMISMKNDESSHDYPEATRWPQVS